MQVLILEPLAIEHEAGTPVRICSATDQDVELPPALAEEFLLSEELQRLCREHFEDNPEDLCEALQWLD